MLHRYWQLCIHIITEDFFEGIADDVEGRFDTSDFDENDKIHLPIGKLTKAPGFFKLELGGKIIIEVAALRPKACAYLMGDFNEIKKAKGTKKTAIKSILMYENYKYCLFNGAVMLRSQQRLKSGFHKMNTEKVNKIALSSEDNKRLQTVDRVITFPYGTNVFKLCENEMLNVRKANETLKILSRVWKRNVCRM